MPASGASPLMAHATLTGGLRGLSASAADAEEGAVAPVLVAGCEATALSGACETGSLVCTAVPPHAATVSTSRLSAMRDRPLINFIYVLPVHDAMHKYPKTIN